MSSQITTRSVSLSPSPPRSDLVTVNRDSFTPNMSQQAADNLIPSDLEWRSFLGSDDDHADGFELPNLTGHSSTLSNKELVDVLNQSCKGFTIVTARSRRGKNTFDFGCNRGGQYRPNTGPSRQRQTSTCKIGCKWSMTGRIDGPVWELRVKHSEHDYKDDQGRLVVHAPEGDSRSSSLKRIRQLSPADTSYIEEQFYANVQPFKIMTLLNCRFTKANEQCPIIKRDLYNLRQEYLQRQISSGTAIQTLADRLEQDSRFEYRMKKDDSNRLTHLLFIKKSCLELFKQHHDIILLDCTYKTNRYRMPLLNMAFVTNLHTTVNLGFGFMIRERESDYM